MPCAQSIILYHSETILDNSLIIDHVLMFNFVIYVEIKHMSSISCESYPKLSLCLLKFKLITIIVFSRIKLSKGGGVENGS